MNGEHLYLIKLENSDESFYKIGTSVHRYSRFYQITYWIVALPDTDWIVALPDTYWIVALP
ncbi:MAG: hypothetical protein WC332_00760 [Clostridia bacterium]|jgi:hypothetical protein